MIICMSGIPGAGKTHAARQIVAAMGSCATLVSADDYLPPNPKGADFASAHARCYLDALHAVEAQNNVIVDNTNLTLWELSPYALLASAFSVPFQVRRIHCDVATAYERQKHGVPMATFCQMFARFAERNVHPWWDVLELGT